MARPTEKYSKTPGGEAVYDRFATIYDLAMAPMEWMGLSRWRRRLWGYARGPRILEVGVGTGKNLPYYPPCGSVTAVDISPAMLKQARLKVRRLGITVDLQVVDVQRLPFPDQTFDAILASFVFCSVADPIQGLHELGRVTKPDGLIALLEHVRPPGVFGRLFDLVNPLTTRLGGPNVNRRTVENVGKAGLQIEHVENLLDGLVVLIVARPGPGLGRSR
ncbi:MAG: class I SAM-dependent methyltransferase [Chloroflexota bacterium]|nr:MAG: class I SAM-dependent methyltransferase [Chloroflexota bacterium]